MLKILNEIEYYIKTTGDGIILQCINGEYVLENKSFVDGMIHTPHIQGIGPTLEICFDNFLFCLENNLQKSENNQNEDEDNYLKYLYSSY